MQRGIPAFLSMFLLANEAGAQIAAERAKRLQSLQHYSEADYLSARCRAYDLSFHAKAALPPGYRNLSAMLKEALRNQPVQPSRASACDELLAKFGPDGSLERNWIELR